MSEVLCFIYFFDVQVFYSEALCVVKVAYNVVCVSRARFFHKFSGFIQTAAASSVTNNLKYLCIHLSLYVFLHIDKGYMCTVMNKTVETSFLSDSITWKLKEIVTFSSYPI